jgi:hypothetical protein
MTARVMLATPMTTTMARRMLPTRTTRTQTFQNLCRNIRFSGLAEGGLRVALNFCIFAKKSRLEAYAIAIAS